jgi:hypothetical protein
MEKINVEELKAVPQLKLLKDIRDAAEQILVGRMGKLIDDEKLMKVDEMFENGNLSILSSCFESNLTTLSALEKQKDSINIIDISNCNNKITDYCLDEFKEFPPYLQTNMCLTPDGQKYAWPGNKGKVPYEMAWRKKYEGFKLKGLIEILAAAAKYKGKLIV